MTLLGCVLCFVSHFAFGCDLNIPGEEALEVNLLCFNVDVFVLVGSTRLQRADIKYP